MEKKFIAVLLSLSLWACGGTDSTQNIRDNETHVVAEDEVDNRQVPPDTIGVDTTSTRQQ